MSERGTVPKPHWHDTHEKFVPSSATVACSLNLHNLSSCSTSSVAIRPHRFSASFRVASEQIPSGSRLSRMVPLNRKGSCGIAVRERRRVSNPIVEMSTPSTVIVPAPDNSTSLNSACKQELFPAPVDLGTTERMYPQSRTRCEGRTRRTSSSDNSNLEYFACEHTPSRWHYRLSDLFARPHFK